MNKYLLKIICLLFISVTGFTQSKDETKYKERAAEVQQEVWDGSDKAFGITAIPDKYANESAVIIARSVEISNSSKRKYKFGGGPVKQYKYFTTIRERVLIKDKSALDEFSTLNYKKVADNTVRASFYKLLKTTKTYIGARIFKQDGKTFSVNTAEEEVLTKNSDKNKEGKIAIPDLQIGDILDYYFRIEEVVEDESKTMGPDLYFLGDDHPILYYKVKYILEKKCGADIMTANGARPMKESTDEDDNNILEFTENDVPKINSNLWSSMARQIPYYVIRYGFPGAGIVAKAGEIKKGPFTDFFKNNIKNAFISMTRSVDKSPNKAMEEYFGGRKKIKELPVDSVVNYLYNYYRWLGYGSFSNMDVSNDRNYNRMNWYTTAVAICEILKIHEIQSDIVLVCNRFSGRLTEVFGISDFEVFIKVTSGNGKLTWLCFNGFFQDAGQLAANYQGEDALLLTREGRGMLARFTSTEQAIKLPVAKAAENILTEDLKVNFNKDNLQVITIERISKTTGSMKQGDQKKLLLAEDVEAAFAAMINKDKVTDKLAGRRKTKDQASEIQTALDNERLKQKDLFKDEIKEQFGQDAKELMSFKIINPGLSVPEPVFEFTETFTMDNFVKKAGNNYILDVGKLMGTYSRIEKKDSARTLDIYMPSARSLTYNFFITLPEGYNIKGIDELNKKVENNISSFASAAKLDGNMITVSVSRTYNNNFEPAANWPKLVNVMNTTADFTTMKLLLEKKK